jgi:hypothetical protein
MEGSISFWLRKDIYFLKNIAAHPRCPTKMNKLTLGLFGLAALVVGPTGTPSASYAADKISNPPQVVETQKEQTIEGIIKEAMLSYSKGDLSKADELAKRAEEVAGEDPKAISNCCSILLR